MSSRSRHIPGVLSIILSLAFVLSLVRPAAAAHENGGILREINSQTGKVHFIRSQGGRPIPAAQAIGSAADRSMDPALAIALHFGPEFGLREPDRELTPLRAGHGEDGRLTVHYQQVYQEIPVLGGELIVNTDGKGAFYSINGEVAAGLSLSTRPAIPAEEAGQAALQAAAKWYKLSPADFLVSEPSLWIYDAALLNSSRRPAELVWRMEVTPVDPVLPVRELVLVNAQRGGISLHFNQIDTWVGSLRDKELGKKGLGDGGRAAMLISPAGGLRKTYTANHTENLPGQLLCDQTQAACTNGTIPDADKAHRYAAETWSFYHSHHGRDSIDNQGMTIVSTVQYSVDFVNAFWDGTQMVYGDDMVADDIVGHELSHGVTQHESNLFYYYQSGAINESFSDIWGELFDQANGSGNDSAAVAWQIGEDSPVGAFRSMSNPAQFNDPDSITSPNYDTDPLLIDNGGVHHNSGVNNKAAYLMVAGGAFGGKTVSALGVNKTLAVYYEAQSNLLTSGADYADLYGALYQACLHLVGGAQGMTTANCQEVRDATDAVRMNAQPAGYPNFNTDAPYCGPDLHPETVFLDDIEAGTANWTFGWRLGGSRWQVDSPDGAFAHSGLHSLYANDRPAIITDSFARLKAITIPPGAYLRFSQAYGFEDFFILGSFDGGVLEYSTNGGSSWLDAGPLFLNNGYNGTIDSGYGNPLGGRAAFVADSHGYISSRLDLSSLANQSVMFRWRMGLDGGVNDFGWWVDDVHIYTCAPASNPPITLRLNSTEARDGWILESSETSGQGGRSNSTGPGLRVGDGVSDRQYRAILSFATGQIPDNAVIQSVRLRLKFLKTTGTDPFTSHGSLVVDLNKGPLGGDASLQNVDFQASASRPAIMQVSSTPNNGWYRADLSSSNFDAVNLTGMTQLRLRFTLDDNDDMGEDYIVFNSGNAVSGWPQLVITYTVP